MGEVADGMVSGLLCEWCGVYIDGDEPKHPRLCEDCQEEADNRHEILKAWVNDWN